MWGGGPRDARAAFSVEVWEASKADERAAKAKDNGGASVLDDVALALPALTRAEKLQKRAARVGFDWPEPGQVLDKVEEEIGELRAELPRRPAADGKEGGNRARIGEEIGDLLFALANLARQLGIDPEAALRDGNAKFTRRFHYIEQQIEKQGNKSVDVGLDEMEALWRAAKAAERRNAG